MSRATSAAAVAPRSKIHIYPRVMLAVSQINPAAYNPRSITPEMFAALMDSIREHGFLKDLVVQKKGSTLIAGHQALKAVKQICIEDGEEIPELPAIILDVDDRTAKKLNIALNKIDGDFDAKLLSELLETIHEDAPISLAEAASMGFQREEMGKYLQLGTPGPTGDGDTGSFANSVTLSLQFDDVKKRDALKELIAKRVELDKKRSGDIVLAAMLRKIPKSK